MADSSQTAASAPELAQGAVMVKSVPVTEGTPVVKGYDFNKGRDLDGIMSAAMTTGFQVCTGNRMVHLVTTIPDTRFAIALRNIL